MMTQTVYVRFSYEDKVSQEIAIDLRTSIDLSKNSNRKKLFNGLLKQNQNITEVTVLIFILSIIQKINTNTITNSITNTIRPLMSSPVLRLPQLGHILEIDLPLGYHVYQQL